jgi:hypothetical protein
VPQPRRARAHPSGWSSSPRASRRTSTTRACSAGAGRTGRGNHYLFDMNRDWMAGTQPRRAGAGRRCSSFHPQLFVDAHEMGSDDTFLFYLAANRYNPDAARQHVDVARALRATPRRAFDAHGWRTTRASGPTRGAPFYSDAWASLTARRGSLRAGDTRASR